MGKVTTNIAVIAACCVMLGACGGGGADQTAAPGDVLLAQAVAVQDQKRVPVAVPNEAGAALTSSTVGFIDLSNPFFKPFGNGRTCASCHQESQGWSIKPDALQAKFTATNGTDPVFRLVDGANSPNLRDVTLDQKRIAYSMLLTKGVIRVGLPIPADAEFELTKADDPYGFASAKELSLFRRPLPTTNLKFISTVMWDARETFSDANVNTCIVGSVPAQCFASRDFNLLHQANSAVKGHAEAAQGLTSAEQQSIVDFEKTLFTAQISDNGAGSLIADGARGGPLELSKNDFYFGINDFLAGDYKVHAPFNANAMTLFGAWRQAGPPPPPPPGNPRTPPPPPPTNAGNARAAIARGEAIFNTRPMNIVGVKGLNDELRVQSFRGTCTSCHDTPNSGTHSVPRLFNTGVSDMVRRTADMPLYTLRNITTGEVIETTDPGRAMLTGKWKDVGRVKVPSLRGIESRSPYFHDGSVDELVDVVRFYDRRFRMGLNPREIADLTAFLQAL